MPRGDYRHRESKKLKKSAKKPTPPPMSAPLIGAPEVVRKKKPAREEDAE